MKTQMCEKNPLVTLAFFCSIQMTNILPSSAQQNETPPAVAAAYASVEKLVLKEYPKATVDRTNGFLRITFKTRKFMVHNRLKTGEWQNAVEQEGPDRGGILCSVSAAPGPWMGAAMVPQTFDYRYYQSLLLAPYSKENNCHLTAHLDYPDDIKATFLREFSTTVSQFADSKP